jgi:hypothetical protein
MAFGIREPLDDDEREFMDLDSWDGASLTELSPRRIPALSFPFAFHWKRWRVSEGRRTLKA